MMYERILVAVDGSRQSELAMEAAIAIAKACGASITGCHVYAADMHKVRFVEMEPGLPQRYQDEKRLKELRGTHDEIIGGGMKIISDAYLSPLEKLAEEAGLTYESRTPQGRNYVELLRLIREGGYDLVVLSACGFGKTGREQIGSVAERLLLLAPMADILLIRGPLPDKDKPVLVGIDGSANGYAAMDRAVALAGALCARLEAVSVFDPFFHLGVFGRITEALPEEERARFDFAAQQRLHDEIIDKGLEKIYQEGLDRALMMAEGSAIEAKGSVLKGKVFEKILDMSESDSAGLIILGRWGIHKEEESLVGSNALNVARLSGANVLVAASRMDIDAPFRERRAESLPWTDDALVILGRVPPFARKMAKGAIEDRARKDGKKEVDAATVNAVAAIFGMGKHGKEDTPRGDAPEAELVVFRKVKMLAPDFHRNILKSKIAGKLLEKGQKVLVYEVEETQPSGRVRVGDGTRLEFR